MGWWMHPPTLYTVDASTDSSSRVGGHFQVKMATFVLTRQKLSEPSAIYTFMRYIFALNFFFVCMHFLAASHSNSIRVRSG